MGAVGTTIVLGTPATDSQQPSMTQPLEARGRNTMTVSAAGVGSTSRATPDAITMPAPSVTARPPVASWVSATVTWYAPDRLRVMGPVAVSVCCSAWSVLMVTDPETGPSAWVPSRPPVPPLGRVMVPAASL